MTYLGEKVVGNFKESAKTKKDSRAHRKDEKYLEFVRTLPSLLSMTTDSIVAHHLLSVPGTRGAGMKAPDMYAVPLTWQEHDALHRQCVAKTEEAWFDQHGLARVILLAERLYKLRDDYAACIVMIKHHRRESIHLGPRIG